MPSRLRRCLSMLASSVVIGALGAGGASALGPIQPSAPDPTVPAPAAPSPGRAVERIPVVVTLKGQPSTPSEALETSNLAAQDELLARWKDEYDFQVDRRFGFLFHGMSGTVPLSSLGRLSMEPEVESVARERVYERLEHSARQLHGVPAAFAAEGVDGTGTVIAVIDSGVDPQHRDMRLDDCSAAKITEINPAPEGHFSCKVPTGYNYADESFVVKDDSAAPHGMHVAGIAAANGSPGDEAEDVETTGRIDGIAPNAQVLAMKVFSNNGGGAADSDIIAAIEDSVKLGADVINMSLGSPNGLKGTSDGSSVAIDAAREAGVITVVAAGNDGQNYSLDGGPDDALGLHDDGTVAAPATNGSAFSVASLDNTEVTQAAAYIGAEERKIPYELATGTPDGETHEVVDIGIADEAGIAGRDLNGAYALIERGELTFTEKYENAISAGAGGVIMYNNEAGGDAPFGMAGVEDFSIPGIVITRTDGLALAELAAAGEASIRITEDLIVSENPTGTQPSSFTSWGTTPTLDFEPEIAGIGGSVYSTYNDDNYGPSSGTSMASPNVAGLSALVLQHLAESRPEITGAARVDLARTLLMNTAVVPTTGAGVPYSPRQVGAGLALVDRALSSQVTATVDGQAAVALREMDGPASFSVTLRSSAEEDLAFVIPAGQDVLAETNEAGAPTTVRVSGGTLAASAQRVVVPAGGAAEVEVTVTPESGADHFLGGWFRLASQTEVQPDLTIPYLGFQGDWNAEPIILAPGEQLVPGLDLTTQLVASWAGMTVPMNSELGEFWLSPNGDGDMDTMAVNMAVLRNARDVEYEILTDAGEHIATIGQEQSVRRMLLGDYLAVENPADLQWLGATYDGAVWNAQTAGFEPLPDGRYIYRVKARLGEDSPWQTTDMPFGVDATAPEITFGALEQGVLTFTITEEGSGLLAAPTVTTAAGEELEVIESPDGSYAVEVDAATVSHLTVSVLDAGFNLGVASKILSAEQLVIDNAAALENDVLNPASAVVSDGMLVVSGYVSDEVAAVSVDGQDPVDSSNGRFRDGVELVEGQQSVTVEALDADGAVVASQTLTVTYDATAPQIDLSETELDASGAVVLDDQGSVTLRGTVTDERAAAEDVSLTLGEGEEATPVELDADGGFETTVTPAEDQSTIVLVASDGANEASAALPIAGRAPAPAPFAMPTISNADCSFEQGACFVPGSTADVNEDGSVFTMVGRVSPGTRSFVLTPGARVGEDGTFTGGEPIAADIAADGSFTIALPVGTGENHFRLEVTDAEGQVRIDRALRVFFDVTAPTLTVSEPTLIGGTLYTRTEDVTVAGEAADDGWGYALALNGSTILERFDLSSPGEEFNARTFSEDIVVADGDTLLITQQDANGNVLIGAIPVVLDQQAPTVAIDGIRDGQMLREDREATVTAEDENLATMTVSLDGEVVSEQATELSTHEHPVEDALIDARELDTVAPEEGSFGADAASVEGSAGDTDVPAAEEDGVEQAEAAPTGPAVMSARTGADEQRLEAVVSTADLAPGHHTITVHSTDLAGNASARTIAFTVDSVLEVVGADSAELEIHREQLGDQQALAEKLLEQFTAELDGDAEKATAAGAELALAPNTVLVEGEQTVVVRAVDASGRIAEREVTVTLTLAEVTLTDGDVTATGTFRSDDALHAEISAEDGDRLLTASTDFASLTAEISLPAQKGSRVLRVLADGTEVPVASRVEDGRLIFSGPSHGTYRIVAPARDTDPGDGSGPGGGSGSDDGSGPGMGDGSEDQGGTDQGDARPGTGGGSDDGVQGERVDGSGSGADGQGGSNGSAGSQAEAGERASGPVARTGYETLGAVSVAVALLLGGALLLRMRRRT